MFIVDEIVVFEERLRAAELVPDPTVFDELLADDVILVAENGHPFFAKQKVVDAHRGGGAPKFTRVEMRDQQVVDHGGAAVVTCTGTYEGPHGSATLRFMRVWVRKGGNWRIVAGSVSTG